MIRSRVCRDFCSCILLLTFFLIIAGAVFTVVVFHLNTPTSKLTSVAVQNLNYGSSPTPFVAATLIAEVSIKNKNYGQFKFQETEVTMTYEGIPVGFQKATEVCVNMQSRKTMNVSIEVKVDSSVVDVNKLSDDVVNRKRVNMRCVAVFRGRISKLKSSYRRRTSILNCTMTLNLASHGVENIQCSHDS